MPTVCPDSSVVREHPHSEGPGFESGSGHWGGGGGVNDIREEKSYDQMGTRTQDLSQNTLTT